MPQISSRSLDDLFICELGLTSTQWSEYSENTKRIQYSAVLTSDITAEAVTVDGFVLSQKDTAGVVTTAPRPLAIQKDTYGWDLSKNICEVYGQHGYIRTAYTYTPYGQVTAEGDSEQTFQWSSEFNDTELGLVYYNYRHYNPVDGRWIGRDLLESLNLYKYVGNNIVALDSLGVAYVEYRTVRVSTGGFCSTICIKELNNPDLTPQVLVDKWIIPSWWGRKSAPGWVMQENPSRLNYRLSGKWEKHRFNQYSPYESYKTKEVPIQSVSWPSGDAFSIDG